MLWPTEFAHSTIIWDSRVGIYNCTCTYAYNNNAKQHRRRVPWQLLRGGVSCVSSWMMVMVLVVGWLSNVYGDYQNPWQHQRHTNSDFNYIAAPVSLN